MTARRHRRGRAGVTLLEVLVASAILAMIATMIYTAFQYTGRLNARLSGRQERDHYARIALNRMMVDMRSAYLSAHVNTNTVLLAVVTGFVARHETTGDRVDFTAFSHRRLLRSVHEGDACEVGYRVEARRGPQQFYDLVRRESPRVDNDPIHGGTLDVLVPDVTGFILKYYDNTTDQWVETWDTTQANGQQGRLPSRIRATLILRDTDGAERRYMSETSPMIPSVLRFGLNIFSH